jgi:hypothetical protein
MCIEPTTVLESFGQKRGELKDASPGIEESLERVSEQLGREQKKIQLPLSRLVQSDFLFLLGQEQALFPCPKLTV